PALPRRRRDALAVPDNQVTQSDLAAFTMAGPQRTGVEEAEQGGRLPVRPASVVDLGVVRLDFVVAQCVESDGHVTGCQPPQLSHGPLRSPETIAGQDSLPGRIPPPGK